MNIIPFDQLHTSDLIVDAVYEGGNAGNVSDDPINRLLPVGNQGGFRYNGTIDDLRIIVLFSSAEDKDWPDTFDPLTGIFKYYGDNKVPGNSLHNTPKKGNQILKLLFDSLYRVDNPRVDIPPIFIFQKYPTRYSSRSVQFKGLCVPGMQNRKSMEDLLAVWKTTHGQRFQNYAAFFTVLDAARIPRTWLNDLAKGKKNSSSIPRVFKEWETKGAYKPLVSERTISYRSTDEQMPQLKSERELLEAVFQYFKGSPDLFEFFASEVYLMTDTNLLIDEVTRGVIDGGRDAVGRLKIGLDSDPIYVDFALEAKCYNPGISSGKQNTVGVKETSRLISRIRNRQFGVLVTTSAVAKQAYEEVRFDQHPIILVSGGDLIKILIERGYNTKKALCTYLEQNYRKV